MNAKILLWAQLADHPQSISLANYKCRTKIKDQEASQVCAKPAGSQEGTCEKLTCKVIFETPYRYHHESKFVDSPNPL